MAFDDAAAVCASEHMMGKRVGAPVAAVTLGAPPACHVWMLDLSESESESRGYLELAVG